MTGRHWCKSISTIQARGKTPTPCKAAHHWEKPASFLEFIIAEENRWEPRHSLGGHFGPVVDLAWSPDGAILLSASLDQTARITALSAQGKWLEVARPQVALVAGKAPSPRQDLASRSM